MSKKKKIIVIILFVAVILCAVLASIGMNYKKPTNSKKDEEIEEIKPKIIEEYTTVELNTLKKYDEYLDFEDNKIQYYDSGDTYVVYKNGVLLNTPEIIKNTNIYNEFVSFKKYDFYIEDGYEKFCIKNKTNNEIECYDSIQKVSNLQDSTDYLILTKTDNDNKYVYLLNPNTDTLVDLSKINVDVIYSGSMANDESGDIYTYEYDYLAACSTFDKCGLINYEGKIIIDYIYDMVDYIDKNTIIVTKNDKQGIINYKNEVKLPLEYDSIEVLSNHIITIKDFKLNVLNRKMKTLVSNIEIDASESETGYNYYLNINDDNLYIYIDENTNKKMYLINSKFQRKIESIGELEYVYDNNEDMNLKYITFSYVDNNKLNIVFYDLDLYEYYTFTKDIKNKIDFYTSIDVSYKNKNYFVISLNYELSKFNEYYYVDLLNSKEIDEITALGKHFSNGYTYTIVDNKLNIYKEKELLNSFNGYFTHINEYTFLKTVNGTSEILTLEFKKEAREVE